MSKNLKRAPPTVSMVDWKHLGQQVDDVSHHMGLPAGATHMSFDVYSASVGGRLHLLMVQDLAK